MTDKEPIKKLGKISDILSELAWRWRYSQIFENLNNAVMWIHGPGEPPESEISNALLWAKKRVDEEMEILRKQLLQVVGEEKKSKG